MICSVVCIATVAYWRIGSGFIVASGTLEAFSGRLLAVARTAMRLLPGKRSCNAVRAQEEY